MRADAAERSLGELRRLLREGEAREFEALDERVAAIERLLLERTARLALVGEALPDAVRQRGGPDSDLQHALRPEIEQAIHRSVREEPTVFAEAIYPVMGPVIRRLVQRLFEGEASKSLKPYRVEQLFLIHRASGLIIAHQVASGVVTRDADMISGMLDAIRSFVQDAFDAHDFDGLRSMKVGDVNVRIEWSPLVVLAAVVRGIEPVTLQPALEHALSMFHEHHGEDLERFDGDSEPFDGLSLQLKDVLERAAPLPQPPGPRAWLKPVALTVLALVVIALIERVREGGNWERAILALERAPGIVVTDHERGFRRARIHGLRDPDAADSRAILAAEGVSLEGLDIRWEPFISDDPQIKLRRAARVLEPPAGVAMSVIGRELVVSGDAPPGWFERARRSAPTLDGIDALREEAPPREATRERP